MIRLLTTAAAAMALLPLAVQAQSTNRADLDYCTALGAKYARYVGSAETSPRRLARRFDLESRVAMAKCEEGDAATAIPILERKLTNAKVPLPERG